MDIKGKNVLITGASSGIGAAAAIEAATRGAFPILVARRREELARVAALIQNNTGRLPLFQSCDLTQETDRKALTTWLAGVVDSLPVLINNAGITAHGRFDQTRPEVLERTMQVNFFAPVFLTQELLPLMRKAEGKKKIVLVSTPSALHGVPGRFAYSASKAAGHAWIETIRIELKDEGFDTLLFCPGYTTTALRTSGLAGDGSTLEEEQASGARTPEDVAKLLLVAIRKDERIAFTNAAGRYLYYMRTMAPGTLENALGKKLKKDFQK
ncbi:MAG: SDR family NAD(P)-dependent oxidoreductase [Leptospirales bacterium]|nr:SDR family NAD(P)-dependent oxidoreductase [Leptospirales bacterium]